MFDRFFRRAPQETSHVIVKLSRQVAADAVGFDYAHAWTCSTCRPTEAHPIPMMLRIRCRENRPDGPSNYVVDADGSRRSGHATVPTHQLTWNGMAEERGWSTDPVRCPACLAGLTVDAFKRQRRLAADEHALQLAAATLAQRAQAIVDTP